MSGLTYDAVVYNYWENGLCNGNMRTIEYPATICKITIDLNHYYTALIKLHIS